MDGALLICYCRWIKLPVNWDFRIKVRALYKVSIGPLLSHSFGLEEQAFLDDDDDDQCLLTVPVFSYLLCPIQGYMDKKKYQNNTQCFLSSITEVPASLPSSFELSESFHHGPLNNFQGIQLHCEGKNKENEFMTSVLK